MSTIHINPKLISNAEFDTACRILWTSVQQYFAQPGVKEAYEKWLLTDEGKRAAQRKTKKE